MLTNIHFIGWESWRSTQLATNSTQLGCQYRTQSSHARVRATIGSDPELARTLSPT